MGLLGDATGDHFYIIEEGEYKLTQSALYVINGFIRSLVWGVYVYMVYTAHRPRH